ncbi:MAG: tetratricopeptide repeat protein, partial [Planctomycetes bacterium]|nr:tetratricopeptide repeat protein [Planctomycetota bacterium]
MHRAILRRATLRWATHPVLLAILLGLAVAAVAPAQESSIIVPLIANPAPAVVSPAPANPALPATSTDSSILEPMPAGEPMRIAQPGLAPSTLTPVEAGGNAAPQPASANPDGHNHEAPLEPIQMVNPDDPVVVEPASFKGVTPGATTTAQIREAWGNPIRSTSQDGMVRHLYAIEPFEHIEVTFSGDKVASVVIRLNHAYPSTGVAKQLDLVNVRPVLVADELGNVLGQAYPERGVLFSFTAEANLDGKDRNVNQIVLEPLSADTFVLRAETYLDSRCEQSLADLNQALKMNPSHARAYWLRARVLSVLGKADESLVSSSKAVQLESANPRYRLTYARALERAGRINEAVSEVREAIATSDKRVHVKARALCM